jgi:hypothetical protein
MRFASVSLVRLFDRKDTNMADTMNAQARVKAEKTQRRFFGSDGEGKDTVMNDVQRSSVKFVETGETLDMNFEEIEDFKKLPAGVVRSGFAWGVMTAVTNAVGGVKDPAMLLETAAARWESIRDGSWTSGTRVGPRLEDFVEAVKRKLVAAGAKVDEALLGAIREKVKANLEASRNYIADEMKADPELESHYLAIQNEKREQRRKSLLEAAGQKPKASADDLLARYV